jgi:hypothetical protein
MSNARRIRRTAVIAALASSLGAGAAMAAPALTATAPVQAVLTDASSGSPSASASVGVTVVQSITITFNSGSSFSLAPNTPASNATNFTVSTNDGRGYTVDMSAPDLQTGGGATIPATSLSYSSWIGGSEVDSGPQQLTNNPAVAFTRSQSTAGETVSQNWLASLPANTPPGSYQSVIQYTALGN